MNKIFLIPLALCAFTSASYAVSLNGLYVSGMTGYAQTVGEYDIQTVMKKFYNTTVVYPNIGAKSGGKMFLQASAGYAKTCGDLYFASEFYGSYDPTQPVIDACTAINPASVPPTDPVSTIDRYAPKLGIGVAGKIGYVVTPTFLALAQLGLQCDFSQDIFVDTFASGKIEHGANRYKAWTLVPGVGIQGTITPSLSWNIGVDYKFIFSMRTSDVSAWVKKPSTMRAKIGLAYHF